MNLGSGQWGVSDGGAPRSDPCKTSHVDLWLSLPATVILEATCSRGQGYQREESCLTCVSFVNERNAPFLGHPTEIWGSFVTAAQPRLAQPDWYLQGVPQTPVRQHVQSVTFSFRFVPSLEKWCHCSSKYLRVSFDSSLFLTWRNHRIWGPAPFPPLHPSPLLFFRSRHLSPGPRPWPPSWPPCLSSELQLSEAARINFLRHKSDHITLFLENPRRLSLTSEGTNLYPLGLLSPPVLEPPLCPAQPGRRSPLPVGTVPPSFLCPVCAALSVLLQPPPDSSFKTCSNVCFSDANALGRINPSLSFSGRTEHTFPQRPVFSRVFVRLSRSKGLRGRKLGEKWN